ncbi:MAG: DGQHR domain-containing protein [Rhodobacteraceae bacterium]|nr:DGQHR domain-containing protein [Paracoccaceae bacterium]
MEDIRELDYELQDIEDHERRKKQVLARLLDGLQNKGNHHLAIQVNMGEVQSYLTSVSLSWVAEMVGFASDLPSFRRDEEDSAVPKAYSDDLELRQQRTPDWTRQRDIATYLASRRHHKFPALLLVGYQTWVYDDRSEKWGEDRRAMSDSLNIMSLDSTGMCWELDDTNTNFYALDGQHRLMAILGLRELIQSGHLPARDKKGNLKSAGGLSRDEIIRQTNEDKVEAHERLQCLMRERIGVEIIPAIRRGESEQEGRLRLRQMFVDVNEHAKHLTKSELSQLDESNGYRVVARRLLAKHSLLGTPPGTPPLPDGRNKVEIKNIQLNDSSDCYTTLSTIVEIVRAYLKENTSLDARDKYAAWDNLIVKKVSIRPEDSELNEATRDMIEYFNLLADIPSHRAFIQGKPAGEIRRPDPGDDNILFRPLVQEELARAVGILAARGFSPRNVLKTLAAKESEGHLKLTDRKGPWFGVLCDVEEKMRRHKKNKDICCRLLVFLLGGGAEDDIEREQLREDFAKQRIIDLEKGTAINHDGETVKIDQVQLPNPWR